MWRAEPAPNVNLIQSAPSPLPEEPFDNSSHAFYNVRRYRKFFNVDTKVSPSPQQQRTHLR
jgi:hypothetical protein